MDTLQGGPGNDYYLRGGEGSDEHTGDEGEDRLYSRDGTTSHDFLDGGEDTDVCVTDPGEFSVLNCEGR